ncbi:hypothetical protein KBD20_03960 [Candidatus Saccharibacteria bacterium]|nr:hypothetical protein [Candidatus Saccharibacteria bacterium]
MKYSTKGALFGAGLASVLTFGLAKTAEANSLSAEEIRADRIEAISTCVGVLSMEETKFNEFPSDCQEVRQDIPYTLTETIQHTAGDFGIEQAVGANTEQTFVLPPSRVVEDLDIDSYVEDILKGDAELDRLLVGLGAVSFFATFVGTGAMFGERRDPENDEEAGQQTLVITL